MLELLDKALTYIVEKNLGDAASVIALIITIIGFTVTIIAVLRSKQISEKVSDEVEQIRQDFRKVETVSDIASTLAIMDEIKRLHRYKANEYLPDRYTSIKKYLISIKSSNTILSDDDRKTIQGAITLFSGLEKKVDEEISNGIETIDIAKTNSLISKQVDKIQVVLLRLRNEIGERS